MKAFVFKTSIIVLALLGFIAVYGSFCDWFFASPEYLDRISNKRAWALSKSGNSYDAAVLGSSRAFDSFDMQMLNNLTQKKIINLAANGSGYVDNYLTLHQFLRNGNTIEELLLQVDIYSLNAKQSFSNAFHTYQFLPYWEDETIKLGIEEYLQRDEKYLWNVFPAVRYFKYNKYFSIKEVLKRYRIAASQQISPFELSLGGPPQKVEDGADKIFAKKQNERSLDSVDIKYLTNIVEMCREKNIRVIAYKAPEHETQKNSIKNYNVLEKKVDTILKDLGLNYLLPPQDIEKNLRYFYDGTHLNKLGAEAFTKKFADVCR